MKYDIVVAHDWLSAMGGITVRNWQFSKDFGLHMRHGTEPEMMWLKKDANGNPDGGLSRPYCYHIDQFESLRPIYMKVIEYGRKMGLDMIQGDHEDAPGQIELNFNYDDALRTADRLTTYRQICSQVAREFNVIACFMCKPFMGVSANGCHHNVSLWTGGTDEFKPLGNDRGNLPGFESNYMYRRGGTNTFLPDGDDPQMPGKIGLYVIGGIVKHLAALTAIGCSTVNSYRRLWDTGFWAPVFADWGFQNRTTGLRVSAPGRFEYRAVELHGEPVSDGRSNIEGGGRRHQKQDRSRQAGRKKHLRRHGGRQAGKEIADDARRRA